MTGYQEVLTDPSYAGQIVTMTAPQIGNYGVAPDDVESRAPQVAGFIMRDESPIASNWRADGTLRDYLVAQRHRRDLRHRHARADARAALGRRHARRHRHRATSTRASSWRRRARFRRWKASDLVQGRHLRRRRSTGRRDAGCDDEFAPRAASGAPARPLRVAAYDFGMKWNILRRFAAHGCDVRVFPATTPAAELLASKPDGVFLSNGPGDPAVLDLRDRQRARAGRTRTCRCSASASATRCSALALGGKTYKLKFGHRGANHPVKELETGQGRDHLAEPRLRRRSRVAAGGRRR